MITALRKIENRGELPGATSAVMEMCVDNPREGFADLFATHPSVDSRVAALVQFAGGHDPGPIALPDSYESQPEGEAGDEQGSPTGPHVPESGPYAPETGAYSPGGDKPFLPSRPPIEIGDNPPAPSGP